MTPAKINGESGHPCSTLSTDSVQPSSTVRSTFWVSRRLLRAQPRSLLQQCAPVKTSFLSSCVPVQMYMQNWPKHFFCYLEYKPIKIKSLTLRAKLFLWPWKAKAAVICPVGHRLVKAEVFVHFQLVKCEVLQPTVLVLLKKKPQQGRLCHRFCQFSSFSLMLQIPKVTLSGNFSMNAFS